MSRYCARIRGRDEEFGVSFSNAMPSIGNTRSKLLYKLRNGQVASNAVDSTEASVASSAYNPDTQYDRPSNRAFNAGLSNSASQFCGSHSSAANGDLASSQNQLPSYPGFRSSPAYWNFGAQESPKTVLLKETEL